MNRMSSIFPSSESVFASCMSGNFSTQVPSASFPVILPTRAVALHPRPPEPQSQRWVRGCFLVFRKSLI